MKKRRLRSGFTTGACAAAAAKAAALVLLRSVRDRIRNGEGPGPDPPSPLSQVTIPFPDGRRVSFNVSTTVLVRDSGLVGRASVIKDAGDDPDITNGAEIVAEVKYLGSLVTPPSIFVRGGEGVGKVTKPGLAVAVGEAAINPVPLKMIAGAVAEAAADDLPLLTGKGASLALSSSLGLPAVLEVTISVPGGAELARKTLNSRLGIVGGISILGTTGVVNPVSAEAWTATIAATMDVARAGGCREVVLSAGRTSEKAHVKKYRLPEESYVLMGDYLEFSLREAWKHGFGTLHLCAQWAKMLKIAMATPQTHVRYGAIDIVRAVAFLNNIGIVLPGVQGFNTAREIFESITSQGTASASTTLLRVCDAARRYAGRFIGRTPLRVHLVSYEGDIIVSSE